MPYIENHSFNDFFVGDIAVFVPANCAVEVFSLSDEQVASVNLNPDLKYVETTELEKFDAIRYPDPHIIGESEQRNEQDQPKETE